MMLKYCILVGCFLSSINLIAASNKSVESCVKVMTPTGVLNCGYEKMLKVVETATALKNIDLFPGVSITSDSNQRMPKHLPEDYTLPENPHQRNDKLAQLLLNAANKFITGRSLVIKFNNNTVETISKAVAEGRARMKRVSNPWAVGLGATTLMMITAILGGLTLFTAKALLVSKAALIVAVALFAGIFINNNSVPPQFSGYGPGVNQLGSWNPYGWYPERISRERTFQDTDIVEGNAI